MEANLTIPKGRRFPIGAKVLVLIAISLLIAVSAIVFNATYMFKKDNLNNVYLSSDLMTAPKAREVRVWLDEAIKKGGLIATVLSSTKGGKELEQFKTDAELLFVQTYQNPGAVGPLGFQAGRYWLNPKLAPQAQLNDAKFSDFIQSLKPRFDILDTGAVQVNNVILPGGALVLLLNYPYQRATNGKHTSILSVGVKMERFLANFSDTGPYTLFLVNQEGKLIAHPDTALVKEGKSLLDMPIVSRMLASSIEREFQEYKYEDHDYLGSYAKVGIGGLGVVSQVSRQIAFETGDILVSRSLWIAIFVFSAVFIVAYLLTQGIVSPILGLRRASHAVSKGNFKIRVDVKSHDEMRDLATSFNVMTSEIERKIDDLSKINEAGHIVSSTLESQRLLEFTTDTLMTLLHCNLGLAWFGAEDGTVTANRGWARDEAQDLIMSTIEEGREKQRPFLFQIGSKKLLAAPIRDDSENKGFVLVGGRTDGRQFDENDLSLAGTLLSNVNTTFQNIKLLKETADKARMEKELETARHVQNTMFPPATLLLGGLEVQSFYTPAAECGGDWWTCTDLGNGKVLLAIGDVTGHGVPSALVTATAKASISVLQQMAKGAPTLAGSPRAMLHFLNQAIYDITHGKILMTFFLGVLDTATGELTYSTASHDPIYWYTKAPGQTLDQPADRTGIRVLEVEPGPRLGHREDAQYEQAKVTLSPGDVLLLYTDGLPEAPNAALEEYGDRRFLKSFAAHVSLPTAELREKLLEDFWKHVDGATLQDDVTLAVCSYKKSA